MSGDDAGLLGNLPRTRPGTRSEKRDGAAAPKPQPARERARGPARHEGGDPVSDLIRSAAEVAEAGARTAGALARAVLSRLPRP